MSISLKIKRLRNEKGYSLNYLGLLSETSVSYLWAIENRRCLNPSADKLVKISCALGVTIGYLTEDNEELCNSMTKKDFFMKFNKLSEIDKKRIKAIVDAWLVG